MKKLIICERPFMLYKALLLQLNNEDQDIDVVLSNHMPGLEKMYAPLKNEHIFSDVFYFADDLYQEYIKDDKMSDFVEFPNILFSWPKKFIKYKSYQKKAIELPLPDGLDLKKYDEIIAIDGVSTINFHLNHDKIPYVVSEHGRGNFRNKVPLHILAVYISIILDRLNLAVAYSGMSKYVKAVEVDSKENLVGYIKKKPIRECRISDLENSLSKEKKDRLYRIYAEAFNMPKEYKEEVNLLLTGPLAVDKILASENDQINCYKDAVETNCGRDELLIVKPHPRDTVCYDKVFPDAIIIDKVVTSEILSFCENLRINKVITIYSTSLASFRNAKDVVMLGDSFLNNYNRVSYECGRSIYSTDEVKK